jgi:uncharacterized protein (DUF2164 family)
MDRKNNIKLSKEKREQMAMAIKTYFSTERDEELGDLASDMILDFFVNELASEFYNQGVYDSYRYMNERCEDLLAILK